MAWVRLDDAFRRHPKIVGVSDRAFRLHMYALSYCGENLTDGNLDARALRILEVEVGWKARRYVDELVAAKLWHTAGDGCSVNDYLEYNPDAVTVRRTRAERSAAGKRGAAAKHGKSSGKSQSNGYGKSHGKALMPRPVPIEELRAVSESGHEGELVDIRTLITAALEEATA